MENIVNNPKLCNCCQHDTEINDMYRLVAKYYKDNGVTEEQYLKCWNEKYPLMEKQTTDTLIELLFHTFE